MKKFFLVVFVLILGTALTLGMAYAIDHNRMETGKPVVFSTWGKKYAPKAETKEPAKQSDAEDVETNSDSVLPEQMEVTLYFADADLLYLRPEKRTLETKYGIEKAVAEAVIAGPQTKDYLPSVTDDVKVISASVADGSTTCVVDLSKEFALNNTGGSSAETFAIYSIVNSLCQLPGIDNVKINIEGDSAAVFGGHYDITKAIPADMTLVAE